MNCPFCGETYQGLAADCSCTAEAEAWLADPANAPHEHDFILQSTSYDPCDAPYGTMCAFSCGCGARKSRVVREIRLGEATPNLRDGPFHMADIERWLHPEDTTRPPGSKGA